MITPNKLRLEPNLTEEQLAKLYLSYKDDDISLKQKHHKLFMEIKKFWNIYKREILRDPNNAHLRRDITKG